jgi:hypothetical protein
MPYAGLHKNTVALCAYKDLRISKSDLGMQKSSFAGDISSILVIGWEGS